MDGWRHTHKHIQKETRLLMMEEEAGKFTPVSSDDDDGGLCLKDEEEYHQWIRHFNQPLVIKEINI